MTIKKTLEELRAARWEDLTPEERDERGHIAFEEARRAAEEYAARNGGPSKRRSEDIIREMRDERDRQMMERMGMIPVGDDAAWERVRERDRRRAEERCLELEREQAERERAAAERKA